MRRATNMLIARRTFRSTIATCLAGCALLTGCGWVAPNTTDHTAWKLGTAPPKSDPAFHKEVSRDPFPSASQSGL
jgi:hypothetical protein